MTEATWYSVGVDLSQIPWQIATTEVDGSTSFADGCPDMPTAGEPASEHRDIEGVVAAVRQLAAHRGALPIAIVLHAAPGRRSDRFSSEVARRLGLEAAAVQLHVAGPHDEATDVASSGAIALGAARSAAAIGHAATVSPGSAALAGPSGVSLGSGGFGSAGVPLGSGGTVASTGVPLGLSSGSGPVGVPIGMSQGVGPGGQPLAGAGGVGGGPSSHGGDLARKLLRLPVVVGTTIALVVVSAVVVVASLDDSPSAAPALSSVPLAAEPSANAASATNANSTPVVETTVPATTVEALSVVTSATCAVGSWLADNDAYLAAMQTAALGTAIQWDAVTGAVRLNISADGAVVTTYDEWVLTSTLGGAGSATTSVVGEDRNTVSFAGDGTYTVTDTKIASQTKVSSGGFSILDGPSQDSLLRGSSTYTCEGDLLELVQHAASDFGAADLVMVFARGD